ncbi:C6 zinc finger domain protein [Botrytis cinerea]
MAPNTPIGYIVQFQASDGSPIDGNTIITPYNNKAQMNPSAQLNGTSGRQAKKRPNLPKVRSGCVTCKRRRIKCDERKPECNRCQVFGVACEGYGVRISINRRKPDPKPLLPRTDEVSPISLSPQSSHSQQLSPHSSPSMRLPFRDESEERYFRTYLTKTSISVTWSRSRVFSSSLWDRIIMQAAHDESYLREMLVAIGSFAESKDVQSRGYADEAVQMRVFAVKRYGLALRSMSVGLSKLETSEGPRKALIEVASKILRQWLRNYRGKNYKAGLCSPDSGVIEDELVQAFLRLDKQVATFGDPGTSDEHKETIYESVETIQNMPSIFPDLQEARLYLELIERRSIHFGYLAAELAAAKKTDPSTAIIAKNSFKEEYSLPEVVDIRALKYEIAQSLIRWTSAFDLFCSGIPPLETDQVAGANLLRAQSIAMDIIMKIAPGGPEPDHMAIIPEYQSILAITEKIIDETKDQRQLGSFKFEQGVVMPLHIAAKWCHDHTIRKRAIDLLRSYRDGDGEPMREGVWDSDMFAEWDECASEKKDGSVWGDGSERIGDGHMRNAAKDKNQIFRLIGSVNWERRSSSGSSRSDMGRSSGSPRSDIGRGTSGSPRSEQGQGGTGTCVELGDAEGWVEELPVRASP